MLRHAILYIDPLIQNLSASLRAIFYYLHTLCQVSWPERHVPHLSDLSEYSDKIAILEAALRDMQKGYIQPVVIYDFFRPVKGHVQKKTWKEDLGSSNTRIKLMNTLDDAVAPGKTA
jgi:hypothetical protein